MPEMKDSGVKWIGMMPKEWKVIPVKYCFVIGNGSDPKTMDGETPVYGSGSKSFKTCVEYKEGPTVLLGRKGTVNIPQWIEGKYWNVDTAFDTKPKGNYSLKLFFYAAMCFDHDNYSTQTALPSMTQGTYYNFKLPYMLLEEQARIADFLDSKCSEIDALTADIRKEIDVLEEYKKSVITEAVTKGLEPDVEMKESGIDWIGEIPSHWSFPKITHILDYSHPYPIGDGDHGSIKSTEYKDEGIPFIRVQNLGFATDLNMENIVYISEEQNETIKNSSLHPKDILFAKTGATIGKVGIVPNDIPLANTTSHVGKITVARDVNPKFIFYVLASHIGYKQFWDIAAQKSTRPELSIDEIKTIHVLLPKKIEEQTEIVSYLDTRCKQIDAAIYSKKEQLTILEEYKKSVIYEYVTGKKEVTAQ